MITSYQLDHGTNSTWKLQAYLLAIPGNRTLIPHTFTNTTIENTMIGKYNGSIYEQEPISEKIHRTLSELAKYKIHNSTEEIGWVGYKVLAY